MIWFLVYGALAIGLLFFFFFLAKVLGTHSVAGERVHFGDYLNLAGTALNIFVLAIAVVSLQVSVTTYQDAKRSGDEQEDTLKKSRQALDASVATAVAQQELLFQSVATSKKQLGIVQAEWARELAQPDVHLALFYSDQFLVAVNNTSKKMASDVVYTGKGWNLSRPLNGEFQWAEIEGGVQYIRPNGASEPQVAVRGYMGGDNLPPNDGDRVFGNVTVRCPGCLQDRAYWFYFTVGGEGAYREGNASEYSFSAVDATGSAAKLMKSRGLIRMSRRAIRR
jgi:hypothetical protein